MNQNWKLLGVVALLGLAGCSAPNNGSTPNTNTSGNQTSSTGNASGKKRLRIAVIPKMLSNPVFGYANIGAKRAAAELGNVDIEYIGPQKNDPVAQAKTIEDMTAKKWTAFSSRVPTRKSRAKPLIKPSQRAFP